MKAPPPLMEAQGYQRLPLSKYVLGQNIALDAVPAYRAYVPTYFLPSRLIQLHFFQNFSKSSTVESVLGSESGLYSWLEYILFRPDMTLRG